MISNELIRKNAYLPVELAKLSRKNPEAAIRILQAWGEGTMHLVALWDATQEELEKVGIRD